jgi:hypothetical protein
MSRSGFGHVPLDELQRSASLPYFHRFHLSHLAFSSKMRYGLRNPLKMAAIPIEGNWDRLVTVASAVVFFYAGRSRCVKLF